MIGVDDNLGRYVKVNDKEIYGRVYRIEDDMLYMHSIEFKDGSVIKGDRCVECYNVGEINWFGYGDSCWHSRVVIDFIIDNWKSSIMKYVDGEI